MFLASTSLTFDPAWPWSLPDVGMPLLAAAAALLVALTVWTYLGVKNATTRRVLAVLALRLAALLVAFLLVLRPSLAFEEDETVLPSKILIIIDASESMNFTDSFNNLSRWDNARRILTAPAVVRALKSLGQDHKVEIAYYQGAEGIRPFNPEGKADGKRTDIGTWLHELWKTHGGETNLRGLLLFTDGADNGTKHPTLDQAVLWRGVCPVNPFALGLPTTTSKQQDIQIVKIDADPSPAPVKTKLTVKGILNAPGFENSRVKVSLWMEAPNEGLVKKKEDDVVLAKTQGNEATLTCDAPDKPGEYKLTLKVAALPGEVTPLNNEISTYLTVTKDGVSVLWVEGKKRLESIFVLRHALARDPRFRVYYTERLLEAKPNPATADWFDFERKHYDVIVIGDISAKRFSGGRPEVFSTINRLVTNGSVGLLMMGGYETFTNSDWHLADAAPIAQLLPVKLNQPGQIEGDVRMIPTKDGLDHYLLRLLDNPVDNQSLWGKKLDPLDGMTKLGEKTTGATVLATNGAGGEPILVGTQRGKGRVLAFGGDTTYKAWRRSQENLGPYERFWKQVLLWLAQQENIDGNAWVKLDTRRVNASGSQRLGFSVGLRGKGGVEVKNASFKVKVIGPDGVEYDVPTLLESEETRGYFLKADRAGEYRVEVEAKGLEPEREKGIKPPDVTGKASARFLAYAEDLEMLRPAADHDFLMKLAQAGGGAFRLAEERSLLQFLEELKTHKPTHLKASKDHWPDWSQWSRGRQDESWPDQLSALWQSSALACFLLFALFVCGEWALRRWWGLA